MNIKELYSRLDEIIPSSLSCDWDNDGIMCLPDPEREVKKVIFALDVTKDVVEYAVKDGFDLIISHHPLIFRPIKNITDEKLVYLISNRIAVFSFHTRFDRLDNGVNYALAEELGLTVSERFGEDDLGVICELGEPMCDTELALTVRERLCAKRIDGVFTGRKCKRVALVGGSGDDYIEAAYDAGADVYISGELGYNDLTDASALGMSLIAAGHYYTEQPSLKKLEKIVKEILPAVFTEIIGCNLIETL